MRKSMVRKGLVLGTIMLFIGAGVVPSIFIRNVRADLGDGLVGYWSFDKGSGSIVHDSSGYGNDGTVYGASWTTDSPSDEGYALDFDGKDDYVEIPDSSSLDLLNSLTLAAWVTRKGPGSESPLVYEMIVSKHQTHNSRSYNLEIRQPYQQAEIEIIDPNNALYDSRGNTVLNDNEWYHLAATYDYDTGMLNVYVNGQLDNSENVGQHNLMQTSVPVIIGAYVEGLPIPFSSRILIKLASVNLGGGWVKCCKESSFFKFNSSVSRAIKLLNNFVNTSLAKGLGHFFKDVMNIRAAENILFRVTFSKLTVGRRSELLFHCIIFMLFLRV